MKEILITTIAIMLAIAILAILPKFLAGILIILTSPWVISLICFTLLLILIVFWGKSQIIQTQIKKIKRNGVVSIQFLPEYIYCNNSTYFTDSEHTHISLNPFAILTKNSNQPKTYKLSIPFLDYNEYDSTVKLHYYSTVYWLNDVSNVKSVIKHGVKNNHKLTTARQLAPIIQEHLQIKDEIEELRQRDIKISNSAKLVATSNIYNQRLHIYETVLRKIRNCLKQAEQLEQSYTRLVKEMLIGIKVAEEELQHVPDKETSFDLQYQRIQEEYNNMKDAVSAYYELLRDSRNTQV